jgi:cytochrome c556
MKLVRSLVLISATSALAVTAFAQNFQKPEDAVKYRKAAMTVMATHWGTLGAMANGRAPYDAAAASRSADVITLVSTLPWAGFTAATEKTESKAKPEIWSESAKFKESQDKLHADISKVAAAAKTGSVDNLKAAWTANSGSCKSCHDSFRKE